MKQILPFRSKFAPGQRVRISEQGIKYHVHHPGTMGVVTRSYFTMEAVEVLLDGQNPERAAYYSPDFWEAITETASY